MRKFLIILLIIIGIIVAGVLIYLKTRKSTDFEPVIKQRLSKLVNEASGGLYKLEIEQLQIDILDSKLTLVKAHLIPDTAVYASLEKQRRAPNDIFDIFVDKLSLDDIDIAKLATDKNISLNKLFIDAPAVKVWHKKQPYNIPADSNKTIYQQISKDIKSIKVDTLLVKNVSFTHYNKLKDNKKTHFEKVNLIFTGLLMDSTTQFDENRFLYAEDCRISLKDYSINTADNLYRFSASSLEIRTRDKFMELGDISLKPKLNHKDFYDKVVTERDIFNIDIKKLNFKQVSWWSLLAEESFASSEMNIMNGDIRIFHDKRRPDGTKSNLGKFPHQLLAKIPFNIEIDAIKVADIDVSYEEVNPKSEESGTIKFDDIAGTVTNVTNNAELIAKNKSCVIDVKAAFLKKTPVHATFNFDLTSVKKGDFTVKASIGAISPDQLNTILIPLALVKINSVNIRGVDLSVRGNNYTGWGTVKLLYDDLNITAFKNNGDTLKKRALLSFIANTFIIKKENPEKGKDPRIESGVHQHIPTRSFFNLIWKTIFVAAAKTVGYKAKGEKQ